MERIISGDERTLLENMLDRNREALIESVVRLSDAASRSRRVPSATTPIGLLRHGAAAERFWFQHILDGRSKEDCSGPATPGEASFAIPDGRSLDDVVDEFRSASAQSREIVSAYDMSDTFQNSHGADVSVRWLLLHMIEEIARHAGHADILVELITAEAAAT
ncbi:DinB family protein [Gordonia sp. SL306]|uniref:DinB family protein n=1 Tax=Gordonia sp. SL306 TaxID=2995145 RepID=UPI00226DCB46|nr:DinB family protein [Gordonia sp. SL306]WAC57201.1 DinB family protein [Gordonia sp. SL306]